MAGYLSWLEKFLFNFSVSEEFLLRYSWLRIWCCLCLLSQAVAWVAAEVQVPSQAWCSWLRIQHCRSCGVGCSCGLDLIPGLGSSMYHKCGRKKKKKKKEKKVVLLRGVLASRGRWLPLSWVCGFYPSEYHRWHHSDVMEAVGAVPPELQYCDAQVGPGSLTLSSQTHVTPVCPRRPRCEFVMEGGILGGCPFWF